MKDLEKYFFIRLLVTNFMTEKELPVRCIHPLTGIPNRFRREFYEAIGDKNKKMVFEAIEYFKNKG